MELDLKLIREDMARYEQALLDRDGPYGGYRKHPHGRCDLYASTDFAIMRTIMGEELQSLPAKLREEWIDHINSFADDYLKDGGYGDTFGHSRLHANGMVIGALGALGGKQKYPCHLYDDFREPEQVTAWLERIDWVRQWPASHWFWGGMHCFSFSRSCTPQWKEAVRKWLLRNSDDATGYWCRGVVPYDRHQALGGFVHIIPIFEHHGWTFPYMEQTVDSVLAMQLPSGPWFQGDPAFCATYLDLDALYVLSLSQRVTSGYRQEDIRLACQRYLSLLSGEYERHSDRLYGQHPHHVLAAVGIFGLLQDLLPDMVHDDRKWTDIFSDRRLYRTAEVEIG
jgi:hypothetical protein